MRLISLFTGGKDSTLAVEKALEAGHEIVLLVTAKPLEADSWMFHTSCIGVQHLQAEAMGLNHRYVEVSGRRDAEVEELYVALQGLVEEFSADGLLSGGIASRYQRDRIDSVARRLGVQHLAPNWNMEAREVLTDVLRRGYSVLIVATSALGLGSAWLGRRLDREAVGELEKLAEKYGLNPAGEGGDYETLVVDAPFFQKSIKVETEPVWLGDRGYLRIRKASLAPKLL
ncbi:MAG: diphthine--ammonia ligase [Nitrososphaerota archaeon]|nr:diphthine--ammonia ligase [Candidatus Calditenuaceae archaeon]MDW8073259.1 diphthine--ammonia ligase [Nitrososphaerota archaeon]